VNREWPLLYKESGCLGSLAVLPSPRTTVSLRRRCRRPVGALRRGADRRQPLLAALRTGRPNLDVCIVETRVVLLCEVDGLPPCKSLQRAGKGTVTSPDRPRGNRGSRRVWRILHQSHWRECATTGRSTRGCHAAYCATHGANFNYGVGRIGRRTCDGIGTSVHAGEASTCPNAAVGLNPSR